jgi:hypothetical protein
MDSGDLPCSWPASLLHFYPCDLFFILVYFRYVHLLLSFQDQLQYTVTASSLLYSLWLCTCLPYYYHSRASIVVYI